HATAAEGLGGVGDGFRGGLVGQGVQLAGLADVPVLAKPAAEVAAGRAKGEHRRPWQKVIERLLLDGIDAKATGAAVRGQHDLSVLASPYEAEAALAFVELAKTRAQVALGAPVLQPAPVACRNDR